MVNTIRSRSTPALFTRMSSRPYCSSAVASSFSPVDHSATSPAATTACPPAAAISAGDRLHVVPGQVVEYQRRPGPGQGQRLGPAEPVARPGHDGHPPGDRQRFVHFRPFSSQ